MLNVPITPPRVPLIDPRTGLIDRAWYLFFLSLNDAATTSETTVDVGSDLVSLIASYDAALQALEQVVKTQQSPSDLVSQVAEIQKQVEGLETQPRNELGTLSLQNANKVNITGGEISGISPSIPVQSGGTGQSTFTNGQLLIGNSTGNTLSKSTLTAGTNITITNGAGSITIDGVSGATGSFITANAPPKTVTVVNGIITSIV